MSLTPEAIKNKEFTITKFRDGYEPDQVDDFLDEVVLDIEAREAKQAELEQRIQELEAELAAAKEATPQAAAPQAAGGSAPSPDAEKSSTMLQLALELHDKYVHEGEVTRDKLISEGEAKAKTLVDDANAERQDVLRTLSTERVKLEQEIKNLEEFEGEYRSTLKSYIQGQLNTLDQELDIEDVPSHR